MRYHYYYYSGSTYEMEDDPLYIYMCKKFQSLDDYPALFFNIDDDDYSMLALMFPGLNRKLMHTDFIPEGEE